MKKILSFLITFLLVGETYSQTYHFTSPEGYGAAATGGGTPTSSNIEPVSSYTALKNALTGSKSVIIVSGEITIPNGGRLAAVVTNKTILGLPGAKLITNDNTTDGSGILHLRPGSNNVIIRNLIFEGPAAYDVDGWDLISNKGCGKLWVDHCEFRDGLDDQFDNTNGSDGTDNITISWCKFVHLKPAVPGGSGGSADHRFCNLVGGSESDFPSDNRFSITWQNCWWDQGNKDRMARGRNVELHFVSCYWNSNAASNYINLTAGTKGSTVYCENGVFAGSGAAPILADGSGTFNCKLVNCAKGTGAALSNSDIKIKNSAVVQATLGAPSYSYTKIATNQVVDAVTNANCGAGATLQVTSAGTISSSCSTVTGIEESKVAESVAIYPNPFQNDFVIQANGDFEYTIMDLAGIKKMKGLGTDKVEVGAALESGLYLLQIKQNGKASILKINKN